MTSKPGDPEDRRLRRKSAAFRLKHDVGKALRWSAPEEREADPEALRRRLATDLLPSGSGAAKRDVLQNFFEWKREEGPVFREGDPDLTALSTAVSSIGSLLPTLFTLEEEQLYELDDATLEATRACTAFYRRIALDDGPETMRSHGASR
jgi:hypothetical protein